MQNENVKRLNVLYLLLSILIALVLWFYVDEYGNNGSPRLIEQEVVDIPIEYIGEELLADRGLMLNEEGTSTMVDLTLEGPRRLVTKLDNSKIRIVADLSDVRNAGLQTISYDISYSDSDSVSEKKRSISRATVNISELNSKFIEVRCELNGNVAEDYYAGQIEQALDTVEIRGQASDIDKISYAKVTLDLGVDAKETVSAALPLEFYDEYDRRVINEEILSDVEMVRVKLPIYVTKEVRLAVAFKGAPGASVNNLNYEISPATITVSGEAGKLRNVNSILLGEFDLMDLVGKDAATHVYSILIPDGCQNLSGVTQATLRVEFKDMAVTDVTTTLFQYSHMPTGKDINILTEAIKVRIFGTTEDVASVTGDDITVIADLSDYRSAAGTYAVPAMIDISAEGDIGVIGTYQVQVNIREKIPDAVESPESSETPDTP